MNKRLFVSRLSIVAIALTALAAESWAQGTCANPGAPRVGTIEPCVTVDTESGSTRGAPRLEQNYDFDAQAGATYLFTCCSGGGTANYDIAISVWDRSGATLQTCNDDFCSLLSQITWVAPSTGPFTLRVGGFSTSSQGEYTIAFSSDVACAVGGGGTAVPSASTWSLIAAGVLIMLAAAGRLGRVA